MKSYLFTLSLLLVTLFLTDQTLANSESYFYLRCNATDWGLGPENRLLEEAPGILKLDFKVDQAWMMNSGDDCVVVETETLDKWGVNHKRYGVNYYNYTFVAPGSHPISTATPGEAHFKVRYPEPGAYTATLDSNSKILSINPTGEIAAGGVIWTVEGSLIVDDWGKVFSSAFDEPRNFSRLAVDTGNTLWEVPGEKIQAQPNCISEDIVLGLNQANSITASINAFSSENGAEIWTQNMFGTLTGASPLIECQKDQDFILVRWGDEITKLAALNRLDGRILWQISLDKRYSVEYWNDSEVLIRHRTLETRSNELKAYSSKTGLFLWERSFSFDVGTSNNGEGFYLIGETGEIQKINTSDGTIIWSLDADVGRSWPRLIGSTIYLEKWNEKIVNVNPNSGEIIWRKDLSIYDAESIGIRVLDNNTPYLGGVNFSSDSSIIVPLDIETGNDIWLFEHDESSSFKLHLLEGEYYFLDRDEVRRLDSTGQVEWTTHLPQTNQMERFPGNLSAIVDSDEENIYVTYFAASHRMPPAGILALERDSGNLIWDWFENRFAVYMGSTDKRIFMMSVYGSESQAIAK